MDAVRPIDKGQLRERLLQPDVISGSEMLLRSLLLEGVECVFGYPGGAVLYIYDAFYGFEGFRHVLARHEQGAIHAADGYARASGKTGVCIATSGPGATNLITGISMAYKDGIPMVVITGNVPFVSRGTDAFQEADVIGMTLSITKHSYYITDAGDIPAAVRAAFRIAETGRKGPVLIDIPKDISSHKKAFCYGSQDDFLPVQRLSIPDGSAIDAVLREIAAASKPLILCGEGVAQASAHRELYDFAVKANIPVTLTAHGVGDFPRNHRLALGIAGKKDHTLARLALHECDCLIVVGSRLDFRIERELQSLSPTVSIVHVDCADDSEPGLPIQAGCYGELSKVLETLAEKLKTASADWIGGLYDARNGEADPGSPDMAKNHGILTLEEAISIIADSVSDDVHVHVTVDETYIHSRIVDCFHFALPRSLLFPIGMEAPGYSLPAAIGAQMAYPDHTVISISGESGFHKCTQELAVCAIHQIPLKIVVFSGCDPLMSGSPDFVKLADAYGVKGLKVERIEAARERWAEAMKAKGPVLVEFSCHAR